MVLKAKINFGALVNLERIGCPEHWCNLSVDVFFCSHSSVHANAVNGQKKKKGWNCPYRTSICNNHKSEQTCTIGNFNVALSQWQPVAHLKMTFVFQFIRPMQQLQVSGNHRRKPAKQRQFMGFVCKSTHPPMMGALCFVAALANTHLIPTKLTILPHCLPGRWGFSWWCEPSMCFLQNDTVENYLWKLFDAGRSLEMKCVFF